MPSTMTRLGRARTSESALRQLQRPAGRPGVLARKHVAVIGTDVSPHVTGFPQFASAVIRLLQSRAGRLSHPLSEDLGTPPDLVVATLPGPGSAGAAAALAERHHAPLLVLAQGESSPLNVDAASVGARLAAKLEATALRRADRWAVLGEGARQRLTSRGISASIIDSIPYWVDDSSPAKGFGPRSSGGRGTLGLPDGFLVLCPIGDARGAAAVLAAAAELAARGCDARIVLAGRGPRLRGLSESAAALPNLDLLDVPDGDYPAALLGADLLLLSEPADRPDPSMAGRLAGCLAAGQPLIAAVAADGHLALELSRAGRAMVAVPPSRPGLLAAAIEVLRGSGQARAVMAAGARHYTRTWLGLAAATSALESAAASALARRAPSWWGRK